MCNKLIFDNVYNQFRRFSVSPATLKSVKIKSSNSASSHDWLTRQLSDPYVEKARMLNYRCRSAFKLIEIDDRFRILKPGYTVIDCGAAPGSWTQVAVQRVNARASDSNLPVGRVISIDKQQIYPIDGATLLGNLDLRDDLCQAKLRQLLTQQRAEAVISDMAPKATGVSHLDNENIVDLCYVALRLAVQVSDVGATLIIKLWQCGQTKTLQTDILKFYDSVKPVKPPSSRGDSAEIFLLARGFKGLLT